MPSAGGGAVLGGASVRQRRCPACAEAVAAPKARWCGSCGAPLAPLAVETPRGPASRWRRRLSVTTAAVGAAVVTVGIVTDGGVIDRASARSAVLQDPAVTTPDEAVLDRLEPASRPTVPVVDEPTCARTGDRTCFLWSVETDGVDLSVATIADGFVITLDSLRELVVRDADDGTVVWSVETPGGRPGAPLLAAGDLLLLAEGDEVVGRELSTGVERWRTGELGRFTPWEAHPTGDVLILVGEDAAAFEEGRGPDVSAAGLDPVTGALLWQRPGYSVSVGAGDLTVVATEDGALAAYAPTGEPMWRTAPPEGGGALGAWAHGHVISVHDDVTGLSQLHRLVDGAPLGFDGWPATTDDDHTVVQLTGSAELEGTIVLLDEQGEVWRTEVAVWSACVEGARLTAATVELTTCGRGHVTLDRGDGSVLERVAGGDVSGRYREVLGPYELLTTDVDGPTRDVLVGHATTGTELARMPPGTWPVLPQQPGGDAGTGHAVVLHSRGWLTALPLPRPTVVGGVRTQ